MSTTAEIQAYVRANTATAYSYEGDLHALCDLAGVPAGHLLERLGALLETLPQGVLALLQNGSVEELLPILAPFSPASLFAIGEEGVWYDPSDFSTMFQDAAGTVPVTSVEQPVGLILDKSRGLGPELITNGDFSAGSTNWMITAPGANTITISSGSVRIVTNGSADTATLLQPWSGTTAVGKAYVITFDVLPGSTGLLKIVALGVNSTIGAHGFQATPGFKSFILISANTTIIGLSRVVGQSADATIDNISVRELPGNHAYQTTTTSRPVLSAGYNLLTKTEQFDDAAWVKGAISVSANTTSAPDGTISADKLTENALTTNFSASQTVTTQASTVLTISASARVQSGTRYLTLSVDGDSANWLAVNFDLVSGSATQTLNSLYTLVGSPSVISQANGFFRCSFSVQTTAVAASTLRVSLANSSTFVSSSRGRQAYTGDGTSGIYIWGASLVPADQAHLPYQRVNTATDYDTQGFPHYLYFDGVDDSLVTPTITPGIDKVQVFAGVRKLSDAATAIAVETGTNAGSTQNSFGLLAPSTSGANSYRFLSSGSITADVSGAAAGTGVFAPAPTTNTLTGLGDISGDSVILRVNGTQAAISTGDQGTGNYLAYPLFIGRREGTSFPFNGHLYGLVLRFGSNLPIKTIEQAEAWINSKTGAY